MLPLHNVIFFHNYYTIDSTTLFPAYPQHIPTVLFTITLTSILTLLFIYASFAQCDIFSQLLHNWLCNNVSSISSTYTYGIVYNYTTQYTDFAFTYAILFTIWYISTITAQLTLQQCRQHIRNIYIQYCLELFSTVYWLCCLYMLSFPQCDIFLNYYIIHSTTVFTAYPQHIHTVLFTITVPSRLTLLFIYASFTQCDIFPQLLHNWLYNTISSISSTYTYGIVYNYTNQYTDFAVYICFLCTMWYFFTITTQLTLQQCFQHILNIYIRYCLQLHYPVYWLCFYICYPFHNMIYFHNYCTIDSATMSTAYPQHIHPVLFKTILHSILALLFIYAFLSTMWYFPQLLHNSLYNSVYSISSTYTYSTVYNYSTQ